MARSGGHERVRRLTGWAWTLELHGNDSFAPTSPVVADNWQIGDSNSFDTWDLTIGTHLEFRDHSILSLAYVDPLGGHDRQFNGEFRMDVQLLLRGHREAPLCRRR